ncbi:hypothetical protein CMI37_35890 [Candidatus Pacearchaeota archaeon]|nr:hypothetical protein [Candidatus Pacearchaeota archaeon]
MENKNILIIGNKPYSCFPITKIIDTFCNNVRCNFSLPNLNNGSIFDELGLCSHQYENLVLSDYDVKKIIDIYGDVYDVGHIKKYYHRYRENISRYNQVYHARFNTSRQNSFLCSIECPHLLEAIPRTGLTIVIEKLLKDNKVFITNFSIKKEIRHSHYVQKSHIEKEFESEENKRKGLPELVPFCHNTDNEIKILRWLHQNEIIDASLCFLEDKEDPLLNLSGLVPSDYIVDLIKKTYGKYEIKNENFC